MADNPYALRSRFSGQTPAVLRYRYRFATPEPERDLEDLRAWWVDLVGVRGVCLPESFTGWRLRYLFAGLVGLGASSVGLLELGSLLASALALLATGAIFVWLWLVPPALLHLDRHGLWVTRQVTTGYVPWCSLQAIHCDTATGQLHLTFKRGVEPTQVTHHFRVHRAKPNAAGFGFASPSAHGDPAHVFVLTVAPAGLAPVELAMLLGWALEAHGAPSREPQCLVDPNIAAPAIDEHEFDDPLAR